MLGQKRTVTAATHGGSGGGDVEPSRKSAKAASQPVVIKGIPVIHTACLDGNLRLVQYFCSQHDADIEVPDIVGSAPLHVAACCGHLSIIKYLIAAGANIEARDNYHSTPLVVTSNSEAVELLVSFGASVDATNNNQISARSMSMTNPYIALAIKQGLRKLADRRNRTLELVSLYCGRRVQQSGTGDDDTGGAMLPSVVMPVSFSRVLHDRKLLQSASASGSATADIGSPGSPRVTSPPFEPELTALNSLSPLTGPLTVPESLMRVSALGFDLGPSALSARTSSHDDIVPFPAGLAELVVDYMYPTPPPLASPIPSPSSKLEHMQQGL